MRVPPRWLAFWPLNMSAWQLHRHQYSYRRWLATPAWACPRRLAQVYRDRPAGFVVDHVVPLNGRTVCGLHVPENLAYVRPAENYRKSNRLWPGMAGEPVPLPLEHVPYQARLGL